MSRGDCTFKPAPIFSDGMVLQREVPLRIWGQACPDQQLEAFFRGERYSLRSGADGRWTLHLPPQEAGGPFELVFVADSSRVAISNILIGDVWLLAGQSNMALPLARALDLYEQEVRHAENWWIRQFRVPATCSFQGPQEDLPEGIWQAVNPQTVLEFSALGYFFAQAHYERYGVPVGLVLTAVSGSFIEAWLSEEVIRSVGGYEAIVAECKKPGYIEELTQGRSERLLSWYGELNSKDLGIQPDQIPWSSGELDDSHWDSILVPKLWRETSLGNLHGAVWCRKKIKLSEDEAQQRALLRLGNIVDADETYVNGVLVGQASNKYAQRKYEVPPGVLKAGENTIAVRVIIFRGSGGGFVEEKSYALELASANIDLSGEWKYKVGCRMEPLPPSILVHHKPSGMYNAMIAPLRGCALRGVLWYQGEANARAPENYGKLFRELIASWRRHFGDAKLPFLFVQLPNYDTTLEDLPPGNWALVREAQLQTLQVPHTAMAVAIDVGEANDLHPQNKRDVALRLFLAARRLVFGEPVAAQGPLYARMERENGALKVFFTGVEGGLRAKGGELKWFEVCGADGVFHPARAGIQGEAVRVWSESVPDPRGVRYAWHDNPEGANLYNAKGLPASPFRARLAEDTGPA